jgi:hypothetical protein
MGVGSLEAIMAKRDATETIDAMHQVQVHDLKSKLISLNEKYKHTIAALKESDERLQAILGLRDDVAGTPAKHFSVKSKKGHGESTAVLVTSDWHLEERVDPATVDGINEYTPEIATARVGKFFANGLSMVEMCRTRTKIDVCILAVLGDLITNTIHEDLAESNYLSPTEATLKAYSLLCGGIDMLLEHGGFKKILVVCNFGNHGRTTKRYRVATAAKNSYEWMMYHLVAERYNSDPRIEFSIADGYFAFADVYGYIIRFHHGNGIKYQGGVGGVTIPLNKAIAQWNKMKRVDLDVIGHWHTRQTARDHVINGSIIGYNAYSIEIKCSYEPPSQSFFLVHPEWGKTVEIPLFVS